MSSLSCTVRSALNWHAHVPARSCLLPMLSCGAQGPSKLFGESGHAGAATCECHSSGEWVGAATPSVASCNACKATMHASRHWPARSSQQTSDIRHQRYCSAQISTNYM